MAGKGAYDYLVVGAGLYGAVFARELALRGKGCLVIDKRAHVAGNAYTERRGDITFQVYGPHIFHTNDAEVWRYVNGFAEFNQYVNSPVAIYKGEVYNLPFNMNTFSRMWGVKTPKEAMAVIESQRRGAGGGDAPANLEEQAIRLVGRDIYEKLVKGYTEKQWGRDCRELPAFIIQRLPLRFTYDNNYYNARYQGMPIGGYTPLVEKILDAPGVTVRTGVDYFDLIQESPSIARRTLFTGPIDAFFGYRFGELAYRSLRFETEELPGEDNYQGNAVVNYTEREVPYTRVIEHKHFEFGSGKGTIITREYPADWSRGEEPYYPINDEKNNALYEKYKALAAGRGDVAFGGRLGNYRYYDMDVAIRAAREAAAAEP